MADEPVDEFFTNLYIFGAMKQRQIDEQNMQNMESEMKAQNGNNNR